VVQQAARKAEREAMRQVRRVQHSTGLLLCKRRFQRKAVEMIRAARVLPSCRVPSSASWLSRGLRWAHCKCLSSIPSLLC
jgi:hypothetical protein